MAGEWRIVALKDIAESINTGLDAITRAPIVSYPTTVRCLRIQDISNNKLISEWGYSEVRAIDYEKYRLRRGEIIMARTCSTGINYLVKEDLQAVFNNGLARIRLFREKAIPAFVYYVFKSREFVNYIDGISGGTSVQLNMKVGDLANFKFPLPPIAKQEAIAGILGALDDKIELNRQRNRTLEAMARALFQSWFVDFDPVKAKAAGKQPPGLKPDIAALFPDTLEETENGIKPTGWTFGTIRSVTSGIQYGYTASAKSNDSGPKFLRITDIRGGQIDWSIVPSCDISEDDESKYSVNDGDILVARTGASTGDNIYLINPKRSVFASYLVRFQFAQKSTGRLVGEFMRTASYFEFVRSALGGSAQPNANAQTLSDCTMFIPPIQIADEFYRIVRPLDVVRTVNDYECSLLTSIRDALLPKLISGELRIPDAERIVARTI